MGQRQSRANNDSNAVKTSTNEHRKDSPSKENEIYTRIRARLDDISKDLDALRDLAPALSMAVVIDGAVVWCTGVGKVCSASTCIATYTTTYMHVDSLTPCALASRHICKYTVTDHQYE